MRLRIEGLEKKFEKSNFDCGYALLNDYLKKQARQNVQRDLSACFVLLDDSDVIKGYYTLSANSIQRNEFQPELIVKLPVSYSELPTILLGRLALDTSIKGQGWGEILLMDALNRCYDISMSLGSIAVVVDPIDENAQSFYKKYGFLLLPDSGKMFIAMKTIEKLF